MNPTQSTQLFYREGGFLAYIMVKPLKPKEQPVQPPTQVFESERVILERAAYDEAGYAYPEDDFENLREREFLYYKNQFPDSYWQWIDQVWRVLDERDGKEYIMYHAYQYVTQPITTPDGKSLSRSHEIDGYYGFYHKPIVKIKEFNPDGSIKKMVLDRLEKVYTIPWSKTALDELLDAPTMRGTTNQFALGLAPTDASLTVPHSTSTQQIRNREDFANHDFDTTMQLGRSQLSTSVPSMEAIQRTLLLRKQLQEKTSSSPTQEKPKAATQQVSNK